MEFLGLQQAAAEVLLICKQFILLACVYIHVSVLFQQQARATTGVASHEALVYVI
jgi:hypothetical protein